MEAFITSPAFLSLPLDSRCGGFLHDSRKALHEAFEALIQDWRAIMVTHRHGVCCKWAGLRQNRLAYLIHKARELSALRTRPAKNSMTASSQHLRPGRSSFHQVAHQSIVAALSATRWDRTVGLIPMAAGHRPRRETRLELRI